MKKTAITIACLSYASAIFAAPVQQYSLSSSASTAQADSTPQQNSQIWQLIQANQQFQDQLRELRGQLEEQQNKIDQLTKDSSDRYTSLDQRIQLLEQKNDSTDTPTTTDPNTTGNTATPSDNSAIRNTDNANTSTADSTAPQVDHEQEAQTAYQNVYQIYQKQGPDKAIKPMEKFIKDYSNSKMVANGYYALGLFYISSNKPNYDKAKENFEIIAGNYPKSQFASGALYQLSTIYKNIELNNAKAKPYYLKLIQKYPNSEEAKKARKTINL